MMTFRKLAADSAGKLLRACFTENTPESAHEFLTEPDKQLDRGGRLTSYYTCRDGRAMAAGPLVSAAAALGVDPLGMPKNEDPDRLFEATRADGGGVWSDHKRKISAFDLTLALHKSVTLAAESAMIWHAIQGPHGRPGP